MQNSVQVTSASRYRPALAWFAAAGAGWVFVLVTLGAFTTSIGAGMVYQDWPLSNGSLNPTGWLRNLGMFAEHSHRLSAGLMSAITLWLAAALWRCEERRWLRRLGWYAVALIVLQAVVGGLRVLLNPMALPGVGSNLGQVFAMLHACLAQTLVCVLLAIAAALSRPWIEGAPEGSFWAGRRLRRFGILCCGLLSAQLAIAAVMRHSFAGLAIPTFPFTPDGGLLPKHWDFGIGINFAHRAMALVLAVTLTGYVVAVWRNHASGSGLRCLGLFVVLLLGVQIDLGAGIVWSARNPYTMTGHVVVGALISATTFLLTWFIHRDHLEDLEPPIVIRPLAPRSPIDEPSPANA
jgi:cytochrome c oxidase assembly protein subunit 15